MEALRTRDYAIDASMWRMHLVVHLRLRRFARRAAAANWPDAAVGEDAARSPELRVHIPAVVTTPTAAQHVSDR
jgi:hypothetical protein